MCCNITVASKSVDSYLAMRLPKYWRMLQCFQYTAYYQAERSPQTMLQTMLQILHAFFYADSKFPCMRLKNRNHNMMRFGAQHNSRNTDREFSEQHDTTECNAPSDLNMAAGNPFDNRQVERQQTRSQRRSNYNWRYLSFTQPKIG